MDFIVIFSSFFSFFLFVVIHALVFRLTETKNVLRGLVVSYALGNVVGVLSIFTLLYFFRVLGDGFYVSFIISFVLFTLLSLSYILGIFGMMVASLRVRILREIYSSKTKGISISDLLAIYNKKKIVDERLLRLLTGGEVSKSGNMYSLVSKRSVFRVHHFLYVTFKKLYNVQQ